MKKRARLNRHQKRFFSRLRSAGGVLAADQWPAACVIERWLKQPLFRSRLEDFRTMAALQRRFDSLNAAARTISDLQAIDLDARVRLRLAHRLLRLADRPLPPVNLPVSRPSARMPSP